MIMKVMLWVHTHMWRYSLSLQATCMHNLYRQLRTDRWILSLRSYIKAWSFLNFPAVAGCLWKQNISYGLASGSSAYTCNSWYLHVIAMSSIQNIRRVQTDQFRGSDRSMSVALERYGGGTFSHVLSTDSQCSRSSCFDARCHSFWSTTNDVLMQVWGGPGHASSGGSADTHRSNSFSFRFVGEHGSWAIVSHFILVQSESLASIEHAPET